MLRHKNTKAWQITFAVSLLLGSILALANPCGAQDPEKMQIVRASTLASASVLISIITNLMRITGTLIGSVLIWKGKKQRDPKTQDSKWSRKLFASGLAAYLLGLVVSILVFSDHHFNTQTRLIILLSASLLALIGPILIITAFKGGFRLIAIGLIFIISSFDFAAAIDWIVLNSTAINYGAYN